MRIALDATALGSQLGGDETLVRAMLRGLPGALGPADEVDLLTGHGVGLPSEIAEHPQVRLTRIARRGGPAHFALDVPIWLRELQRAGHRPDLVVCNTHAPLWSPAPVALVVTDLSFLRVPQTYPAPTRWRLRLLVGSQAPRVAQVVTISEFCRRDLLDAYGLAADRVHVLPLVVDPPGPTDPAVRAALTRRGVPRTYLLYLGNLHPRKNVARAITAFALARRREAGLAGHTLVIAGRRWFHGSAEEEAAALAPPGSVLLLDRVTDAEREVLLHDAAALVYPSVFEGFGLPPLEAMARGIPVLAADATAIPEVCADAALLVDPHDTAALADGITRVLLDEPLRSLLRGRGWARAAHYDVAGVTQAWRGILAHVGSPAPIAS